MIPLEPLTDAEIAAIRARCEAATKGPWKAEQNDYWDDDAQPDDEKALELPFYIEGPEIVEVGDFTYWTCDDATFAAEARTDVPALLSTLDAERAARQAAEADARVKRAKHAGSLLHVSDGLLAQVEDMLGVAIGNAKGAFQDDRNPSVVLGKKANAACGRLRSALVEWQRAVSEGTERLHDEAHAEDDDTRRVVPADALRALADAVKRWEGTA
ncbi:MAG: hypothetical protein KGK07_07330 [Chloroflexota bacterium]|nr:hypothetical protein [Chloroflexota bacterium]